MAYSVNVSMISESFCLADRDVARKRPHLLIFHVLVLKRLCPFSHFSYDCALNKSNPISRTST